MIQSYEDLIRTADAYADSRTLLTGVELDLFTHLGSATRTASTIAQKCHAAPEGIELLLNALVGMGILAKHGNRFRNTSLSRTYLDAASPRSITNFLWLAGQHWEDWMHLTQTVKKGRGTARSPSHDDPVFRKRFAKALHERSFFITPKLIRHIHLGRAKALLDLGGGAGSYAFALIRKTPGLQATIFDRPAAVKVALTEAKKEGLSKSVRVIGGDLFTQDYGGPYDVVFYSNVIHIYGPRENLQVFKKVKRALRPGGRLLIVEYFLDHDRAHPPDVSSFALMMYLFTESGRCYTWDEVTQWLKSTGFSRFRRTRVTEKIGILDATLNSRQG
jgi:SAM-dependent methyltransferase